MAVRPEPFRCSQLLQLLQLLLLATAAGVAAQEDDYAPHITTTEFDYASRGAAKFGDRCQSTLECGFPGSECDPHKRSCQCIPQLPVTNHIDKCGREASVNESCFFNEQCEFLTPQTECRDLRCVCRFELTPTPNKDGVIECIMKPEVPKSERYIDPAMIGVLVGMALMFIIICVVLRLFSNARWRENRTIFNTPNPRLMNVSLLRESKLERRGSRGSVRAPSRRPSMASLRPQSPQSQGSRPGSSNASIRSGRRSPLGDDSSPTIYARGHHQNNHHQSVSTGSPLAHHREDSVTVDIQHARSEI